MKATRRIGIRAIVWGIAVVFAVCAVVFLALAGYLSLSTVMQPHFAALTTGATLLVLAAAALLITYWLTAKSKARARRQQRAESIDQLEEILMSQVDPHLRGWITRHPEGAAASTLVLGIIAGYSRTARRMLQEFYENYAETERERRESRRE
jgi:hypothetical protein